MLPGTKISNSKLAIYVSLVLVITGMVMSPTLFNGFVNFDDGGYVMDNPLVKSLSLANIGSIFSTIQVAGNYHPLTVLSLALDYRLGGGEAFVFHLTNWILHLANVALVFLLTWHLIGKLELALLVSLLFGIHPMHVEPVAWVSSRKDVLYGLFFLSGLLVYLRYLQKGATTKKTWLLCFVLFVAALLSKGIAVTFPVILLGIDQLQQRGPWRKMILEKWPFWLASLVFGIVTILAQDAGTAFETTMSVPWYNALFVASYGLLQYVIKAIVPFGLSPYHPLTEAASTVLPWYFYASLLLVLVLFGGLWYATKGKRQLWFGLFFFLITLAPVMQIIKVGDALMAERYSYLPYWGLFLALVWSLDQWFLKSGKEKATGLNWRWLLPAVVLVVYGGISIRYTKAWEDGNQLWSAVIKTYPEHYFGYGNRGNYWLSQNQHAKALPDFEKCIQLNPQFAPAYNNLGLIKMRQSDMPGALADFDQAIALDPTFHSAYMNRGLLYGQNGNAQAALQDMQQLIQLQPDDPLGYLFRGVTYENMNRLPEAVADYSKAISLEPQKGGYYLNRGKVLQQQQQFQQALNDFNQAVTLSPQNGEAWYMRARANHALGQREAALADVRQAQQLGYQVPALFLQSLNGAPETDP